MKCPKFIDYPEDLASHFRFVHNFDNDRITNILFNEIQKLNDRVTNLCELLEIREK